MPNLNFDLNEINPSENGIKNINLAKPNWEVVNYVLNVAEYWLSDMDIDGFRLDVPNEVPFWFWKLFREKVKSIKIENLPSYVDKLEENIEVDKKKNLIKTKHFLKHVDIDSPNVIKYS